MIVVTITSFTSSSRKIKRKQKSYRVIVCHRTVETPQPIKTLSAVVPLGMSKSKVSPGGGRGGNINEEDIRKIFGKRDTCSGKVKSQICIRSLFFTDRRAFKIDSTCSSKTKAFEMPVLEFSQKLLALLWIFGWKWRP